VSQGLEFLLSLKFRLASEILELIYASHRLEDFFNVFKVLVLGNVKWFIALIRFTFLRTWGFLFVSVCVSVSLSTITSHFVLLLTFSHSLSHLFVYSLTMIMFIFFFCSCFCLCSTFLFNSAHPTFSLLSIFPSVLFPICLFNLYVLSPLSFFLSLAFSKD